MSIDTSSPFEDLQTAIYTLLDGNITGELYDEVGENPTLPYTVFGDILDVPMEARGVKGRKVLFLFNIYSKGSGGKFEAAGIMTEIIELMTAGALTMTSWADCGKTYKEGKIEKMKKDSGYSYKGTLAFLITVCKK